MADPATPPLPQTTAYSSQTPQQSWNMSVLDMPPNSGAMDGQTRANALALAMAGQNAKIAPMMQATSGAGALPAWDPNATSIVGHDIVGGTDPRGRTAGSTMRTANGGVAVDPSAGAWTQGAQQRDANSQFDARLGKLAGSGPNTYDAIHNWMFGGGGSMEGAQYKQQQQTADTFARPEVKQYFSAHPSLLAAAEADPVNFATKLGPILDAATARAQGKISTGTIVHNTLDGPMIKPDDHPEMTLALSKAHGVTAQQAHAMTQGHHYTDQEWLHATEGMSRGALRSMWEMQHYMDPANQAKALALGIGAQKAREGGAGSDAAGDYYKMLQMMAVGPQYPYTMAPGMSGVR